jgi:glycosyltransferase involved in cell wall biosynthesis
MLNIKTSKIVVVSSFARSLVNFRGQLLAALVGAGHEVIACAPSEDREVTARLNELGVRYKAINLDRTSMNPIKDLHSLWHLTKLLRDISPDIVFSYTTKPVIYGSLAAKRADVPESYSMIAGLDFSFGARTPKGRATNLLLRRLYRTSLSTNKAVFFQNPDDLALFVEQSLLDDPGKAVLINGSGVDLSYYHEAPSNTERLTFLLMARLLKEKGAVEYVKAAGILKRRYPQTAFHLLGPLESSHPSGITEAQVKRWQREGAIEYLGEVKDVRPILANASVYVLPSYYPEGTPRSVLEAMAMARPIITTDTPGCRETVVDGDNGFLIPPGNVTALVEAMEYFILNPDSIASMGETSRKMAVEKYDVHEVNATIMETMGLSSAGIHGDSRRRE